MKTVLVAKVSGEAVEVVDSSGVADMLAASKALTMALDELREFIGERPALAGIVIADAHIVNRRAVAGE